MFSVINITDTSFEIITYRTDEMTGADRFVVVKVEENGLFYMTSALLTICAVLVIIVAFIIVRQ